MDGLEESAETAKGKLTYPFAEIPQRGHSIEVARFLLTEPGAPRDSLRLKSASGTIANLKWTRPAYARALSERMGPTVDYSRRPAEDFARGLIVLEDAQGQEAWRTRMEHLQAQKRGRQAFYQEYKLQVCEVLRQSEMKAPAARPQEAPAR